MSGSPGSAGGSDATPPCSLRGTPLAVRSDGRGCGLWLATTAYFHMATRTLETTQTARETRAYALRLGSFHPFVVPAGADRGQGEPGFPFRNPSLGATCGRRLKRLKRPGRPGPTRCVWGPFIPSWCRQALTEGKGNQGSPSGTPPSAQRVGGA